MIPPNVALDYLHDATVRSIGFDLAAEERQLRLVLVAHPDCGYEKLNGKRVTIQIQDVVFMNYVFLGHVIGDEYLSSWDLDLPPARMSEECRNALLGTADAIVPFQTHGLAFSSGSELELVGQSFSIEVDDVA